MDSPHVNLRIATWNINSLRLRLPLLKELIAALEPDVICLQETKVPDELFPAEGPAQLGFPHVLFRGMKGYNGVAILSRLALSDVTNGMPAFADDQKRLIAASVGAGAEALRVVCVYVPNGQAVGTEKYEYKLKWLSACRSWLGIEMGRTTQIAVLGDYNVAPEDADVHDPKAWEGQVLCSAPEREAFRSLLALGLKDAFRLFSQGEKSFTWWDYRMNAFRRNLGLRIDHVLLGSELASRCRGCNIDVEPRRAERPSDHAPIIVELDP